MSGILNGAKVNPGDPNVKSLMEKLAATGAGENADAIDKMMKQQQLQNIIAGSRLG